MVSNAIQTLQCTGSLPEVINEVLGDLMDVCMVGYLDDILVYLDSLEDHRNHVREVL